MLIMITKSYCSYYITGWWLSHPSEKYEFVSWQYEIPNWMERHKIHVPNHQPVKYKKISIDENWVFTIGCHPMNNRISSSDYPSGNEWKWIIRITHLKKTHLNDISKQW